MTEDELDLRTRYGLPGIFEIETQPMAGYRGTDLFSHRQEHRRIDNAVDLDRDRRRNHLLPGRDRRRTRGPLGSDGRRHHAVGVEPQRLRHTKCNGQILAFHEQSLGKPE